MNGIDMFLVQYGLAAIFIVMFAKSIGVPIPIPADVIILATAVRAAQGKFVLWQVFLAILLALVLGGTIQFVLVRGPGRNLLYRFGRYLEVWHEGICPVCLALYTANQLHPLTVEVRA